MRLTYPVFVVVNLAGRVFTIEELRRVGEFCERHDLTIISDEIHCDLILDEGLRHVSMLALDDGVSRGLGVSDKVPGIAVVFSSREMADFP